MLQRCLCASVLMLLCGQAVSQVAEPKPAAPTKQTPTNQTPTKQATTKPEKDEGSTVVRLGSWNIEWLGKPTDRSGQAKGVAQKPEDLADAIIDAKVSILALQEIVTKERGTPIRSREIEAVVDVIKTRTKQQWQYVLFPGRQSGDQLTGVMWNADAVTALNAEGKPWKQEQDSPWKLPIEGGKSAQGSGLWNRPPHAMKFSLGAEKTDLVLIVVHMKADYQGDFAQHRKEEAAGLIKALPEVKKQFKDQDVVVLGDTNCVQEKEPAAADLAGSSFVDLNGGKMQTHWRGGTMDRMFFPSSQPEFAGAKLDVVSESYLKKKKLSPADFKKNYSDHYLVVSEVKVMRDDD